MQSNMNNVESKVDNVKSNMDNVKSNVDNVKSKVDKVESKVDKVESKVDKVEKRVTYNIDQSNVANEKIDKITEKLRSGLQGYSLNNSLSCYLLMLCLSQTKDSFRMGKDIERKRFADS